MDKLMKYEAGGKHEQNPLGGIPIGGGASVEQGETRYDDYIFSDSLKISKQLAKKYNLPDSAVGKTFAEVSEMFDDKERPNDPAVKRMRKKELTYLRNIQESVRPQETNLQMKEGGPVPDLAMLQSIFDKVISQLGVTQNPTISYDYTDNPGFLENMNAVRNNPNSLRKILKLVINDPVLMKFKTVLSPEEIGSVEAFLNSPITPNTPPADSKPVTGTPPQVTSEAVPQVTPEVTPPVAAQSQTPKGGIPNVANVLDSVQGAFENMPVEATVTAQAPNQSYGNKGIPDVFGRSEDFIDGVLRKATAPGGVPPSAYGPTSQGSFGPNTGLVPKSAFGPTSTSPADTFGAIAGGAMKQLPTFMRFAAPLTDLFALGYTLANKPEEIDINKFNSTAQIDPNLIDTSQAVRDIQGEANATRESLREATGGNAGNYVSSLLGSRLQAMKAIGQTNLQGDMINQKELGEVRGLRLQQDLQNQRMRFGVQDINDRNMAAYHNSIIDSVTGIGSNLAGIGTENLRRNMVNQLPIGYFYDSNGNIKFDPNRLST